MGATAACSSQNNRKYAGACGRGFLCHDTQRHDAREEEAWWPCEASGAPCPASGVGWLRALRRQARPRGGLPAGRPLSPSGGRASSSCMLTRFHRIWLLPTPWAVARQAPLSMGISKQEDRSGLPFPSPGDLPDPKIKPVCPAQAGIFFT